MAEVQTRYYLIDALRGFAALGVAMFHTYLNLLDYMPQWPFYADALIRTFIHNVMIFFVISGFVIAYSIRNAEISGAFVGQFILRRSVRLDPPYWAIHILTLAVAYVGVNFISTSKAFLPNPLEYITQLFYLQDVLGYKNYIVISWTLCLEIQFYLFTILVLWFFSTNKNLPAAAVATFLLMALIGMLQKAELLPRMHGLFLPYFYSFFAGVLLWWNINRQVPNWLLWFYLGLLSLFYLQTRDVGVLFTIGTLTLLRIASSNHLLFSGNWKPLQYLGRISYSLYLTHILIGDKATALLLRISPFFTPIESVFVYIIELCLILVFASLFYFAVERPFLNISRKLFSTPQYATT